MAIGLRQSFPAQEILSSNLTVSVRLSLAVNVVLPTYQTSMTYRQRHSLPLLVLRDLPLPLLNSQWLVTARLVQGVLILRQYCILHNRRDHPQTSPHHARLNV